MRERVPKKFSPAIEIALRGIADHIKAGGIILQADFEVEAPDIQLVDRFITATDIACGGITLSIKVPPSAEIRQTVKDLNLALIAAQRGDA